MAKIKDITGQRFGRLVVTGYAEKGHYNCICDCGNIRKVLRQNLVSGKQVSCGCYAKDRTKERMSKHGMTKTPLYIEPKIGNNQSLRKEEQHENTNAEG